MRAQQNAKKNDLDGDHTFCCCSNEKWKKWGWTWTKCLLHQNSWARSGCGVVRHTFTLSQRNTKGKNFCSFFAYFREISVFDAQQKETWIFNSSFCTQLRHTFTAWLQGCSCRVPERSGKPWETIWLSDYLSRSLLSIHISRHGHFCFADPLSCILAKLDYICSFHNNC